MDTKVNYCSVEERDMDTLFLEAISTDKNFLNLFLNKIQNLKENNFQVSNVELSKTDNDGESDITIILQNDNTKILTISQFNIDRRSFLCYTINDETDQWSELYFKEELML